jgi:hypothetical protein
MRKYLDRVAIERGYDDWKNLVDWIARDGELPIVVQQLTEAYVKAAFQLIVEEMSQAAYDQNGEEDKYDRMDCAYRSGVHALEDRLLKVLQDK